LGVLQDESSITKLKTISKSQYPFVALAAHQALYRLGQKESISAIETSARDGNLFAIGVLGEIPESVGTLIELLSDPNFQVRLNATVALMEMRDQSCFRELKSLLIHHRLDYAFVRSSSPGYTLTSWKAISSASNLFKDDVGAYATHIEFREALLTYARAISEEDFLLVADALLAAKQHDLIPHLVDLLEDLSTPQAVALLKKYQSQVGAPLVRNYCNLALYRLNEAGPYGDQLREWVKAQNKETLIQFRPSTPWEIGKGSYELTPEETSRLLVEAFEAFTAHQDEPGIAALLDAIAHGNEKSKYALAGLLIRATQ